MESEPNWWHVASSLTFMCSQRTRDFFCGWQRVKWPKLAGFISCYGQLEVADKDVLNTTGVGCVTIYVNKHLVGETTQNSFL